VIVWIRLSGGTEQRCTVGTAASDKTDQRGGKRFGCQANDDGKLAAALTTDPILALR
jgi:hypothetical protein